MRSLVYGWMFTALLTPIVAVAQDLAPASVPAEVPALSHRVTDNALVLGEAGARLERRLADYEQRTGHQFAVLTISTLGGEPVEQYADRVFRAWKLGDAKRDDGLLFVCVLADRKMRIEVGYGLEGVITDVASKRVLDELARPAFRAGKYADGIEAVLGRLMELADAEASPPAAQAVQTAPPVTDEDLPVGVLLTVLVSLGGLIVAFRRSDAAERSATEEDELAERALAELRRSAVEEPWTNATRTQHARPADQAANDAAVQRMFSDRPRVVPTAGVESRVDSGRRTNPVSRSRQAETNYDSSSGGLLDLFSSSSSSSSSSSFSSSSDSSSSSDDSGGWGGGGGSSGGGGASSDW